MPNYVKNVIKMPGIGKLPLFTLTEGGKTLDFNKLIPMPEDLNVSHGSNIGISVVYFLTKRCKFPLENCAKENVDLMRKMTSPFSLTEAFELAMDINGHPEAEAQEMYNLGKIYVSNYKKHGFVSWYGWCTENWGTKWNACHTYVEDDLVSFSTAWSSPEPVINKLAELYPDAKIEFEWADEDFDNFTNSGCRIFAAGKWSGGCSETKQEGYERYVDLWEESRCLYQDSDGIWHRKNCETCNGC